MATLVHTVFFQWKETDEEIHIVSESSFIDSFHTFNHEKVIKYNNE